MQRASRAGHSREQRKVVTILFADVVGSTSLAGQSDPEVVRSMMSRYFKRVADVAGAYGGTVEKFAGDAAMVVFGVPVVHDDDRVARITPVGVGVDAVGTSQSNISQHLAVLRDTGILAARKNANRVFYRIIDPRVLEMIALTRRIFCTF